MMTKPFDIFSTYVAFVQGNHGGKRRPVLVLYSLGQGKILRIMVITSKYKSKNPKYQCQRYPIKYWRKCGLTKPSYVDIAMHGSILASAFDSKHIGHLDIDDITGLFKFIKNYYNKHK